MTMKKVLVIGSGGAGKSTFATRLGELLGIEVIHLDQFYWRPGWVETPKSEWLETVERLVRKDSWIIDGNYSGSLETRLAACDTVIFLDIARSVCVWRLLKRVVRYRKKNRPDMAEGCEERFNLEFVRWVWNYSSRTKPKVLVRLKENAGRKRIVRLHSSSEVEKFLANSGGARSLSTNQRVANES
jgi:adenylate kinase family enzyme